MKSPLDDAVNDPINEFKPFAVAEDADILGQIEYEQSMILKKGFKRGLARSVEVNKALRPSSSVVSAVTQFMLEKTGRQSATTAISVCCSGSSKPLWGAWCRSGREKPEEGPTRSRCRSVRPCPDWKTV